jgi:hypothetical protein
MWAGRLEALVVVLLRCQGMSRRLDSVSLSILSATKKDI